MMKYIDTAAKISYLFELNSGKIYVQHKALFTTFKDLSS